MKTDLIRSAERWAACSPEAVASGSEAQMRFFVEDAKADIATLLRRIAALEAEASEGERLRAALRSALALIDDYLDYRHDGDPWSEDARLMGEMEVNYAAKDGRLDAILALIPEAPTQRELGSAEANQISTPKVGLPEAPAREGE